ncbi:MAG TPA: hypothetical protein PKM44_11650 [Turneriella sp.]|nr:hypothetical protein [Turneriella sp.]
MARRPKAASDNQNVCPVSTGLPFPLTHSEERIVAELLVTGELREAGFRSRVTAADFLAQQLVSNATQFIDYLQHELFPQEMLLRQRRAERLQPLQGKALRAHFDQSLETPTLTLQARIRSEAEFEDTLRRLQRFNFAEWLRHCEEERADAD